MPSEVGTPPARRWVNAHGPILVVGIALLAGLTGLFSRSVAYHDEVINTAKATNGVVLDYAMRPAFFLINRFALKTFGNHTYALVIISVLSLVITALFLYYICTRYFRPSVGLLCVVAYVGINMVRHSGVRAMAHTHAGMFMVVSLYFALICFTDKTARKQRVFGFAAGLFAIVSFSTHPTMAGYLVALCSWAGITWLLGLSKFTASSVFARPLRPMLWTAIGVVTGILSLLLIYALFYHESYFAAWIRFAKIPQGTEAEREFSLYYVRLLLTKSAVLVPFLLASIAVLTARRLAKKSKLGTSPVALALPLFCLIVGMAMISLNQWKHGRIVLSYLPLIALSFATWTAAAGEALSDWLPRKWGRVLLLLVISFVTMKSTQRVYRCGANDWKHNGDERHKYLSLYETLRNVRDPVIGVLLGPGKLGTQRSFVEAAGLDYVRIKNTDEIVAMPDLDTVKNHLLDQQVRYIYWDLETTTREQYGAIAEKFRAIGGHVLLNWRGLREVWFIRNSSDVFSKTFSTLKPSTKIGIFGEPSELSSQTDYFLRSLLEVHQLAGYTLNVTQRNSARQLYYLTRNEVDYVVLPTSTDNTVTPSKISKMVELLQEIGATKLEEAGMPRLQLWYIGDRERAAARAQ